MPKHYTEISYLERIKTKHRKNIKVLSKFKGTKEPITYRCLKGHKITAKAAEYLFYYGCRQCGVDNKENRKLKPFDYVPCTITASFPVRKQRYVLPPPYNTYYMIYIGRGKWELYSNKGKLFNEPGKDGYINHALYPNEGKAKTLAIHRMVYALKRGDWNFLQLSEKEVDHIDRDTSNNRPSNLRLVNHPEQARNRNMSHILNIEILTKIFKWRAKGYTLKRIAAKFSCHLSTIAYALNHTTHADLADKLDPNLIDKAKNKASSRRLTLGKYKKIFKLRVQEKLSSQDMAPVKCIYSSSNRCHIWRLLFAFS